MTEQPEPQKRKIPYFRLMLLLVVIIMLVAVYTVCIYAPPLRISEETTRITGPLTADGQIDFFRYFEELTYTPEMQTDENGFRIFVRTFGDYGEINDVKLYNDFHKEQRYKKLGLDRSVPPTMVFPVDPVLMLSKLDPADRLWERVEKPWTLEDLPMLTKWIADADVPLDAAAEMIRKPVLLFPYIQAEESTRSGKPQNLNDLLLPDVETCHSEIVRAYQVRATYRIGIGNIDGAIDDVITIYQLGRKIRDGNLITQVCVGIGIEGRANAVPIAANPNQQPTKEQLQRLLDAIDQLPTQSPL